MKTDISLTLNKLIAYAREYLMLDALDEVYTLNRLATLCGVKAVELQETETDETLDALLSELKTAITDVDIDAIKDALMPAPHMVDFYFRDELERKPEKAFEFLYELYDCGGIISDGTCGGVDGYVHYALGNRLARPVMLDVGTPVPYTPIARGNRIASLACDDVLSADIAARLAAYASNYGGTIAKSGDGDFLVCADSAIAHASAKTNIKDGTVKVDILDYPATAVKFSGIAKNAVAREAGALIKSATDAQIPFVAAAAPDGGSAAIYVIFAKELAPDDVISASGALGCCGVVATPDFTPLMSVLEKGTALSTDLFAFKPLYAEIGGVKLGAKAAATLDAAIAKRIKAAIVAANSATEDQVTALLSDKA